MKLTAAQVEKFIARALVHTEEPLAGEPFTLLEWQREVLREIYDDRDAAGHRRCRNYYIETPKGNGKSPFLAAIAIVEFLFSGPGALVYSTAANYAQARDTTFGVARELLLASPVLRRMPGLEVQERQIKGPNGCRWLCMTGDARKGKSGPRPTCVILDELQDQPDRRLLDSIQRSQTKLRHRQPLLLVASNAGLPGSVAHAWHERAARYMRGDRAADLSGFKGRVYGLAPDADWHDRDLWAAANPAIGKIITMDALEETYQQALKDRGTEYGFRQLHLGQWLGQSQTGYIDMGKWAEAAARPLPPPEELADYPCWLAFDLSDLRDLTAVAAVWVGHDRHIYVKTWHWLPRPTAVDYETKYEIPYAAWEKDGHVLLTDTVTIDHTVKAELASHVEALVKGGDVRQVCYDSRRASEIVERLERAGIPCEPISPYFDGVSEPTKDLAARLAAGSITLPPDPCLAWQARNLHVVTSSLGDVRPAKYGNKGKYAGKGETKIDGLTAIILAMARASRYAAALVEPEPPVELAGTFGAPGD